VVTLATPTLLLLLNSSPQPDLVLRPDFLQPMQRQPDPLQQQDLHSSNLKTQESSEQPTTAYKNEEKAVPSDWIWELCNVISWKTVCNDTKHILLNISKIRATERLGVINSNEGHLTFSNFGRIFVGTTLTNNFFHEQSNIPGFCHYSSLDDQSKRPTSTMTCNCNILLVTMA